MYNKIVFLVSSLSQPRAIRRVESIAALGINVEVYGYDRGQYNCNKFSPSIKVNVLGKMSKGGGYLGKVKQIRNDIRSIVDKNKSCNCLYYSFGYLETLFLNIEKVPYAYEISDISYSWGAMSRIKPLFKFIDRRLVRSSVFTLMTSEGFKKYLGVTDANVIIQPNKVNRKLMGCKRTPLDLTSNKFVFSFVGSIRYEPILRFAKVIGERFPQHEFHFYGVANIEYTKQVLSGLTSKYSNIKLFGAFKNPEDFEKIYNNVDVIVTTYGKTPNETILEPNKLYEGILFCRPLIATEGTFLADRIRKYQCGFVIDSSSEDKISSFIGSLTAKMLNKTSRLERAIPDDFAFDNMDKLSALLLSFLQKK